MNIRDASADDLPVLLALNDEVHRIHLQMHPHVFRQTDREELTSWYASMLADEHAAVLIAEDGRNTCAYLILRLIERPAHPFCHPRRYALIDQVCVSQGHRRAGVFAALLEEARTRSRAWNVDRIELDVWTENAVAREAFVRSGFTTYNEKMWMTL